jgi:ribosomal protein S18 acetylase RimI-like enzyme
VSGIRLVVLTEAERRTFVEEELANYADEQVRDAGWPPQGALDRARGELASTLERVLDDASEVGDLLWSAVRADGESVGWLWVKRTGGGAFLKQITVAAVHRRRGYGRAMLNALEATLARDGIDELCLNVNVANTAARRLYAATGYELVSEDERVCRLRKRLA